MNASRTLAVILLMASLENSVAWTQSSSDPAKAKDRARVALAHALPRLDGNRLQVSVVEVHYGPGESSPQHSHPCAVIGYVVEGAIRTKVKGEAEAIYKAGEAFYEAPNGIHEVSANASGSQPAWFIAYFVCDHETALSVDVGADNGVRETNYAKEPTR